MSLRRTRYSARPAHRSFRGLLGVHLRCGPHTRTVTCVTAIRGLQTFRRLHACPGCFRLERLAGWDLHPLESAAFSRRTRDATAYAAWLSARTRGIYRLPTDEEWAYAAGCQFTDDSLSPGNDPNDPSKRWLARYDREAEEEALTPAAPFAQWAASAAMSAACSISRRMFGSGQTLALSPISRPGGSAVGGVDCRLRIPRGRRRAMGPIFPTSSAMRAPGAARRGRPRAIWIPARPRAGGEKVHRLGLARLHQPVGVGHSRGCAHFRQKGRSAAHMRLTLLRGGGGMRCVIYYSIISLAGTAVHHPGSIAQQPSERPGFAIAGFEGVVRQKRGSLCASRQFQVPRSSRSSSQGFVRRVRFFDFVSSKMSELRAR